MPNFKNFANAGIEDGSSSEFSSVRHKQIRETKVGARIERVWATDFDKCVNREDYEKYISKYGKYDTNKYVELARVRIKSIDAAENARIEREKAAQTIQHQPVAPGTGGRGIPPQKKFIQSIMKVAVWLVIIGGVCLYSYNQYKQDRQEKEESNIDVLNNPQEEYTSHTNSEQTYEQETPVVETEPEPQEVWWDCNICNTTGRCQLCFGCGRCAVCGGGGQVFSVFYGDEVGAGRFTNCSNCGGSGKCPACEGSGACFACHGRGKCKLEDNL